MTEDDIQELLQEADRTAGPPAEVHVNLAAVHRRANRRRFTSSAAPVAAAAVLMVAAGLWGLAIRTPQTTQEQERVASLEAQVKQLRARTDAVVRLIQQVLAEEQRRRRLDELEAQLASIPDPLEELEKQVDRTAFILVYQADRLYKELNQTDSAVQNYERVIELFPKNRWAQVARQRLTEIENKKSDKTDSKGDLKWKQQNVLASC